MPRKSKSAAASRQNLSKARSKLKKASNPRAAAAITTESTHASDSEDSDYVPPADEASDAEGGRILDDIVSRFLSHEADTDGESVTSELEDMDDEGEDEISNEAALLRFMDTLSTAQMTAQAAEAEANAGRKRPKRYNKKSHRTAQRRAQKLKEIAKSTQSFIHNWFPRSRELGVVAEPPMDRVPLIEPDETRLAASSTADTSAKLSINDIAEEIVDAAENTEDFRDELEGQHARPIWRDGSEPETRSDGEWRSESDSGEELELLEADVQAGMQGVAEENDRKQAAVDELLRELRERRLPADESPETAVDSDLNTIWWSDFPALRRARAKLTVLSKDKTLDVFYRARITGMVGTLNLFLDPTLDFTWRQASTVAARSQGHGVSHARNLRAWIHAYLKSSKLPLHRYGTYHASILEDEDISQHIQLHLQSLAESGYIRAQDIADFLQTPEMQERLGVKKKTISVRTAQRWLKRMDWRYGKKKRGMYIDGHERPDVVEYREGFIRRWREYERRMFMYNNDGDIERRPTGFDTAHETGRFRLILVTHDESTFYANDRRTTKWTHKADKAEPERKGEGASIMVSDFLTPDFGRLIDGDDEARVIFKAGKNRDGWFAADDLLEQTSRAIDIFESKTNGFATALFMFDNAPSHQKRAPDALSARKMIKHPREHWTHHKDGPKMRDGQLPDGTRQQLYFADNHPTMPGWFKGMELIIKERGLWPEEGLKAACPGFKCEPGRTDCCCRRVLFCQPDFEGQKSQLEEMITARGHLCDFYPKFHCELNFIEMYWGAAKFRYRTTTRTSNIVEMEANMVACLDAVPHLQILRYANRSARFMSAYEQGLTGAQAVWANRKYHSHRTLPADMASLVKEKYATE